MQGRIGDRDAVKASSASIQFAAWRFFRAGHGMRNLLSKTALSLLLFLTACGSHAVDLDHPTLIRSDDPTTVGQIREQVMQIAVDDERLYWSGSKNLITQGSGAGPFFLHSCEKRDCASTLLAYNDVEASGTAVFGVQQGEIYWFRWMTDHTDLVASNVLDPRVTRVVLTRTPAFAMAVDSSRAYFTSYPAGGIAVSSVPLAGAAQAKQLALLTETGVDTLQVQGDYLYWLGAADQTHGSVQRLRTDGTGKVETLARDFEYDLSVVQRSPYNPGGIALDSQSVYWTVNVDSGAILSCPLSGCRGAPQVVVAPVRAPSALLVDQGELYILHESDAFKYAVSSCALAQCDRTTLIADGIDVPNLFALDDRYLYTATTAQDLSSINVDHNVGAVAQIRRLPR